MHKTAMALALLSFCVAAPARAYGLGATHDPELVRVAKAASHYLLAQQSRTGGWAWHVGETRDGANLSGLVAESLLAAYEHTGDARFVQGARAYGDQLVQRRVQRPDDLPFKPDVELLIRLSEVTGDGQDLEAGKAWFQVVKRTSPRGADEVERIITGRRGQPDLTGYDVALAIRAALAADETNYAHALAQAILTRRSEWLKDKRSTFGTISRAALLDALTMADQRRYAAPIATLAAELMREQEENGSWCRNETQATAYAIRALAVAGGPAAADAARRGSRWLASTLLERGAWAHYNDGLPEPFVGDLLNEVQAEALSAVILASRAR